MTTSLCLAMNSSPIVQSSPGRWPVNLIGRMTEMGLHLQGMDIRRGVL